MRLKDHANLGLLWRLSTRIYDVFYPGACAACQRFCDDATFLCGACGGRLQMLIGEAACEQCAKPVAQSGSPCPWCRGKGVSPFKRIVRLGEYEDPLRTLIHRMKYQGQWGLAEALADLLFEQERTRRLLSGADCVIAVPLHWRRQFIRGYNQSDILAGQLARRCGARFVQAVSRVRDTATQTQLRSQQARIENVRNAFALRRARAVEGRHLVLVDDVTTSGATLQAVGRVLRQAKPASICAIVLAVADPKRRDFQAI